MESLNRDSYFNAKGGGECMYDKFTFGEYFSEEYGVIAVHFGTESGGTLYGGQSSNLVTDKADQAIEWEILSQNYKEPMKFTLQIVNEDGSDITQEQERGLTRWLCKRGTYQWLFIQDERYSDIWIRCNMSNPQVWIVGRVKGMQFDVTTSSSIAFSDEREYNYTLTDTDKVIEDIFVYNDEEIFIYPEMEIAMLEAGNLTITNSRETDSAYKTVINNLVVGEVVTIKNDDIASSVSTHNILNDFNLMWLRLYDENNILTFNLKCTVTIKFREYRKLVVY